MISKIKVAGCIRCYGIPIQNGEEVVIELDPVKYPGHTPNPIVGLVTAQTDMMVWNGTETVPGKEYCIDIDPSDLPAGMVLIETCDIDKIDCRTCCDEHNARLLELESKPMIPEVPAGMVCPVLTFVGGAPVWKESPHSATCSTGTLGTPPTPSFSTQTGMHFLFDGTANGFGIYNWDGAAWSTCGSIVAPYGTCSGDASGAPANPPANSLIGGWSHIDSNGVLWMWNPCVSQWVPFHDGLQSEYNPDFVRDPVNGPNLRTANGVDFVAIGDTPVPADWTMTVAGEGGTPGQLLSARFDGSVGINCDPSIGTWGQNKLSLGATPKAINGVATTFAVTGCADCDTLVFSGGSSTSIFNAGGARLALDANCDDYLTVYSGLPAGSVALTSGKPPGQAVGADFVVQTNGSGIDQEAYGITGEYIHRYHVVNNIGTMAVGGNFAFTVVLAGFPHQMWDYASDGTGQQTSSHIDWVYRIMKSAGIFPERLAKKGILPSLKNQANLFTRKGWVELDNDYLIVYSLDDGTYDLFNGDGETVASGLIDGFVAFPVPVGYQKGMSPEQSWHAAQKWHSDRLEENVEVYNDLVNYAKSNGLDELRAAAEEWRPSNPVAGYTPFILETKGETKS